MEQPLPEAGIEGRGTFVVQNHQSTTAFGRQERPFGLPAATDARPEEAVSVLGTPHLLARVEFVGRESVRGQIPEGTGVVGEWANINHKRAASVGTLVHVQTSLEQVNDQSLIFEGFLKHADAETENPIGTARISLKVVDRNQFHEGLIN